MILAPPNLYCFESIVGATENATGFIAATVGGATFTVGGVSIFNAFISGGVIGIFIFGALGALGSLTFTLTLGGVGAFGAFIVILILGVPGTFNAAGGVIFNSSIITLFIVGNFIFGAAIGSFGFGSTFGASKVATVGGVIFNVTGSLLTSFGEIRASISTSLVGSFKFSKSTNPHPLFPFVDEPIEASLFIVTPPFETFPAFAHEL